MAASCEKQSAAYDRLLADLNRTCNTSKDCVAAGLSWSSCTMIAISKDQPVTHVIKEREKLWMQCNYKMAPCGIPPMVALCIAGRCGSRANLKEHESKEKVFLFLVEDRPLANSEVLLQKIVDPYCRVKNCEKTINSFKTDQAGKVSWKFSEIVELVFGARDNTGSELLVDNVFSQKVEFSVQGRRFEIPWHDLFRYPEAVITLRPR